MTYKKGSFVIVPNKDLIRGKKPGLQSVYFWICEHANDEGICWPSAQRIADDSGVGRKNVFIYISELEKLGILERQSRKNGNELNSNLYQILIGGVVVETVLPSSRNGTTPSSPNGTGTVSSINSIQLTQPDKEIFEDFESFALASGWEQREIPGADDNLHMAWFHNGKLQAPGKVASLYTNWKKTQTGPAKLPDIAQARKVDLDDGSIVLESTLRRRAPRASQGHVSYSDKNSRKIIEILKRATNSSSVDGTNIHGSAQEILQKFKTHLISDLGIPEADVERDWAKHFEGLISALAKHKFHGTKIVSVEYINRNFNRLLKEAK